MWVQLPDSISVKDLRNLGAILDAWEIGVWAEVTLESCDEHRRWTVTHDTMGFFDGLYSERSMLTQEQYAAASLAQ